MLFTFLLPQLSSMQSNLCSPIPQTVLGLSHLLIKLRRRAPNEKSIVIHTYIHKHIHTKRKKHRGDKDNCLKFKKNPFKQVNQHPLRCTARKLISHAPF